MRGRSELELFDLAAGGTAGAETAGEIASTALFSRDGGRLAVTVSGAAQPPDVWVAERRVPAVTFAQHAGVDLATFVRPGW